MSDPDRPDPTHRASDQAAEESPDHTGDHAAEQTPQQASELGTGETAHQGSDQVTSSTAAPSEPVDWSLGTNTPPPSEEEEEVPPAAAPPAATAHTSAERQSHDAPEGAPGAAPNAWTEAAPNRGGAAQSNPAPSASGPPQQQPASAPRTNFAYPPYQQDSQATAEFSRGSNAPNAPHSAMSQGQAPYGQAPYGPPSQGAPAAGAMPPGPGPQGPAQQGLAPQGQPPAGPMHQGPPPAGAAPHGQTPPGSAQIDHTQPPASLPPAESRVMYNLIGSLVGLVLVAGGLALALRFSNRIHDFTAGSTDISAAIWTILGAMIVTAPALLARWASWTPIVPGFILAGLSVWAMTTNALDGGGSDKIAVATDWAFDNGEFAFFCMNGMGLMVGLALLLAGIAAVLLRAGVRREIRTKLQQRAPTSEHAPQ